jgi:hypothetical protein
MDTLQNVVVDTAIRFASPMQRPLKAFYYFVLVKSLTTSTACASKPFADSCASVALFCAALLVESTWPEKRSAVNESSAVWLVGKTHTVCGAFHGSQRFDVGSRKGVLVRLFPPSIASLWGKDGRTSATPGSPSPKPLVPAAASASYGACSTFGHGFLAAMSTHPCVVRLPCSPIRTAVVSAR